MLKNKGDQYQILIFKLIRIAQNLFKKREKKRKEKDVLPLMFAQVSINHSTYSIVFLAKYKEMAGGS